MNRTIPIVPHVADEWHIASLVVHTLPQQARFAAERIATLPGAEVHAVAAQGKVIVTLEGPTSQRILDAISAIHALDGVINAALVYQGADSLASMNEELPDVHCP